MQAANTPLLAGEDDSNVVPSLSSGPAATLTEESEFERLLAQASPPSLSPLDALGERYNNEDGSPLPSSANYHAFLDVDPSDLVYGRDPSNMRLLVIPPRGPLTTAVAGAFWILHLSFVWAAYASDKWAESRIRVSVGWQEEYLPLLDEAQEVVVRSTNLTSLLRDLSDSHNYSVMIALWIVSLLLPCAFMIVSPTFVLSDHLHAILYTNRSRCWNGRGTLETSMRWSFLTFFVMVLLSMAISFLDIEWTDTNVQAGNRAHGPLAAYVVGISCAIGLAVVLRCPAKQSVLTASPPPPDVSPQTPLVRSPPAHAFQHPWRPPTVGEQDEDEPTMTVLEDTSNHTPTRNQPQERAASPATTPELISESGDEINRGLPFWYKFAAFQLGLLSLFLWIPVFYLPCLRISYGGLVTSSLTETSPQLFVWEMAGSLWKQGLHFGTPVWILLVVGLVMVLTTLVLPVAATCVAILAWLGDGPWATKCYSWLFALHPTLCGCIFSLALLGVTHALTPFGASLLSKETAGLCDKFHEISGETCLDVTAQLLPGAWFYLVQSIVLELFVLATLRWG